MGNENHPSLMKKLFILLVFLPGLQPAGAQTVLTAAMNMAPVGATDTVSIATGVAPGVAGNGVTWDFSTVALAPAGLGKMVAPPATAYAGTFPTATHAIELSPFGSASPMYEYLLKNSSGLYILASSYSAATPGDNYTPNSKLRIPFPFSFGNSVTDTFQKVGSPLDAYTMTYDGFGTLKTPRGVYNDIVRIKYVWIGGETAYQWYTTSPLAYLATWSQDNGGKFTLIGGSASTGIKDAVQGDFEVFPNPALETVHLRLPAGYAEKNTLACILYDLTGRAVSTVRFEKGEAMLQRQQLPSGLYFYKVLDADQCIGRGRLTFQ